MKKHNRTVRIIFLGVIWTLSILNLSAQSNLLSLSSYQLPLDKPGAFVASVVAPLAVKASKVKIMEDTAKLFRIGKHDGIYLRKGRILRADHGAHAYGLTLEVEGKRYDVELVKDEFLRNKVIAHRGAWRQQGVMQNSIRSFHHAALLGCAGSEFDVWLSKDRIPVLSHDPQIGGLLVEQSTAGQLYTATIGGGDPVPTLSAFIQFAKKQNRTKMILEIKASPSGRSLELADSVVSLVHRLKAQGYLEYISFDYAVLQRILKLDPSARTAYLYGNKTVEELKADAITGLDYDFYHYREDATLIARAKAASLTTNVWTVNAEEELRTFLDSGVDWITTDEPELLLKLINEQKTKKNKR